MTEDEKTLMMNRMKDALPVMRKNLKLSQSDLSALSGVSRGVISNIECGKQNMTWNMFLALASVFRANQNCDKLFDAFSINLKQLNEYLKIRV